MKISYEAKLRMYVKVFVGIDVSKEKTIIIESFVEHGGNKVFFTSCKFKNEDGSKTYAIGRQTQMMVPDPNALFKTSDFE